MDIKKLKKEDEDKIKILIVDDSELVRGMLAQHLEDLNYNVIEADNGVNGIIKAYKEIPDVIVMDVAMPMLQGYQASRLLKNRREIKNIPIIMHTSHTEDKDKFWAFTSGADAFICKESDNFNNLVKTIKKLEKHEPFNNRQIQEDGYKINENSLFELLNSLYDNQLFQSTILNKLGDVGRSIGSLSITANNIFTILNTICEAHIACFLLKYNKQTICYIKPSQELYKNDVDDFYNICLNDYHEKIPELDVDKTEKIIFDISGRDNFDKVRFDKKRISSYTFYELKGKGNSVVGTLHIGNFSNNYFSSLISENISIFAKGVGIIIENSLLFKQVTEMEEKIRNVFSKFVPEEIISDLVEKQSSTSLLIGEKREVAILFSDIRAFTNISENNSAEDIVKFLNTYFEKMGKIIKENGGIIDKFIGDAILAIFGAPVSYEDNAYRAVNAAVQMIETVKELNNSDIKLPESGFNVGIGIHEGNVIVGNIGSKDKFDYTVIGDNVNLASRLEGLTKHYNQKIIISENVKKKIDGKIKTREVDKVKVKGKDKSTSIYSVINDDSYNGEFKKNYETGINMYKMQNWMTAKDYFKKALKSRSNDFLTKMYINRCTKFEKDGKEKNWDGSIKLDFK